MRHSAVGVAGESDRGMLMVSRIGGRDVTADAGLRADGGGCGSGGEVAVADCGWSCSFRRVSDDSPKRRSRDAPRPPVGGGGNTGFTGGSGDGRLMLTAGALTTDVLAVGVSTPVLSGRWFLGGEYGGGGNGPTIKRVSHRNRQVAYFTF